MNLRRTRQVCSRIGNRGRWRLVGILLGMMLLLGSPLAAETVWSFTDHGIVADLEEAQTEPIQKALDALASAGGGTMVLPAGTYRSGTLQLPGGVTLRLEEDAVLVFQPTPESLERFPVLIRADRVRKIGLSGRGRVEGGAVQFTDCRGIVIEELTFSEAAIRLLHRAEEVRIDGISGNHGGKEPVLSLHNARNVRLERCRALGGTDTFIQLHGAGTVDWQLADNDFSRAKRGIFAGPDVPSETRASLH